MAVALVNALAINEASGRRVDPREDQLIARATTALGVTARRPVDRAEAIGLQRLAQRLRQVFTALNAGDVDDAADRLNALLEEGDARPQLGRRGSGWHLHYHQVEAGLVQGWTAGCATALAHLLASDHIGRLGVCAAPRCEGVYLDTSKNGSNRFCATACQNRVKAAAHRARTTVT